MGIESAHKQTLRNEPQIKYDEDTLLEHEAPPITPNVWELEWRNDSGKGAIPVADISEHPGASENHWLVESSLRRLAGPGIEQIAVFPDFSPISSSAEDIVIPTGVAIRVDIAKFPDFIRLVRGADIGCGMMFGEFTGAPHPRDIALHQPEIDHIRTLLKRAHTNRIASLGGGNHFLDLIDVGDKLGFVIHTGSYGDKQNELSRLVGNEDRYWQKYNDTINAGVENRRLILEIIRKVFGQTIHVQDTIHNTIRISRDGRTAIIYKGVIDLISTHGNVIIPSSMDGEMLIFTPTKAHSDLLLHGISHGTGRAIRRSELKEMQGLPSPRVLTPTGLQISRSEHPDGYHPIERAYTIFNDLGILEDDCTIAKPVVYYGHI